MNLWKIIFWKEQKSRKSGEADTGRRPLQVSQVGKAH